MKILKIAVYTTPVPYEPFSHLRLQGASIVLEDVFVRIETECGLVGWGESCPLAPTYLPATSTALAGALERICPGLIGRDPRETGAINHLMDGTVLGHGFAKAAVDMACWDLRGQSAGQPLNAVLGGSVAGPMPVYRSIPVDEPGQMLKTVETFRQQGIRVFQVKIGQGAAQDIPRIRAVADGLQADERMVCDANRALSLADARQIAGVLDDLDPAKAIYFEQPCATYEECLQVRRICKRPFGLDESIDGLHDLIRGIGDDALDLLVIKLSHAGGLTRAMEMIQVALAAGLTLRIEDTVGAECVRSAVAHVASTVPPARLLAVYPHPCNLSVGDDCVSLEDGRFSVGDCAGLGVSIPGPPGELVLNYE